MNLNFLHPFRYLYKLFTKDDSPKQLAFGVALGLVIGLIPKGNLVAATLMVMLFAFRTNLGAGLLTIGGVSAIGTRIDPLLDAIGARILGSPTFYDRMSDWYELPLVPWTSLNNTVVLGGTVLGAALFYPAYHLSEMLFERYYATAKSGLVKFMTRRRSSIPNTVEDSPEGSSDAQSNNSTVPAPHLSRVPIDAVATRGQATDVSGEPIGELPDNVIVDWRRV